MQRVLERLERTLTWQLLAPDSKRLPNAMKATSSQAYQRLMDAIKAARVAVFGVDDGYRDESMRSTDRAAWHFVAMDRDGLPVGALRLFIVDRRHEALRPLDVLDFGHVAFPCPATRASNLEALERFFVQKSGEHTYIYAGGFFTTEPWRGSGLAAVLGMAAIAMARLHNNRFAASFVSARGRAPKLFALLGAQALQDQHGGSLAPFHCPRHGFPLRLMAFDSLRPDPKVERGLDQMTSKMREITVILPEAAAG